MLILYVKPRKKVLKECQTSQISIQFFVEKESRCLRFLLFIAEFSSNCQTYKILHSFILREQSKGSITLSSKWCKDLSSNWTSSKSSKISKKKDKNDPYNIITFINQTILSFPLWDFPPELRLNIIFRIDGMVFLTSLNNYEDFMIWLINRSNFDCKQRWQEDVPKQDQ